LPDDLLPRLEALLGPRESEPRALSGGITNRNFVVRFAGVDHVVRVAGRDTILLGIDRTVERDATAAAAAHGIAPDVSAFLPDVGCLVTRFVPGTPATADQVREPATLGRVAGALRTIHAGEPFATRFDAFEIVETYREVALQRGGTVPASYDEAAHIAAAIHPLLTGPDHDPVPCHDDLLPANLLLDGERLRIVDWEYAGTGDRFFDLANLSVNNEFEADDETRLLEAYFGEPATPQRRARLGLMRVMSDFREAMWGVVQATVSDLDVDFGAYADEHFERLLAAVAQPDHQQRLRDAA
jgi:thiamine kinase-like enzyme